MPKLTFQPSGDTGLTVIAGDTADRATSAEVLRLRLALEAANLPGVIETVPTYLSLLVHYDPLLTSQADLKQAIETLAIGNAGNLSLQPRSWTFPICIDGPDFAPDLDNLAEQTGLSQQAIMDDLTGSEQFVYMLGFAPGQPYLGDLPDRLAIPRRQNPVPHVPAGSVLTATGKTTIYPTDNPTGWHVIGRTPVPIFNAQAEQPALLAPGDNVRFHQIDLSEFQHIEDLAANGSLDPMIEMRQ